MLSKAYSAYKYLYYRLYAWNLRKWGESDMPQFSALFVMLILFSLNLMTVPTAIEVFTGGRLIHNELIPGGVFLAISLISYFLLVHGGKYKKIAKEFSGESPAQRRTRLLGIW